jgi:ribose transport system substrate-binding protein
MRARSTKLVTTLGVVVAASALIAGCTSNSTSSGSSSAAAATAAASAAATTAASADAGASAATGKKMKIGFSAPAADHGWMGAITKASQAEAAKYPDVELVMAEGTNDVNLQISQIETFINDKVDAIVMLPFDGAALTDVAIKAMKAGIR